jgi:hypothetical protein
MLAAGGAVLFLAVIWWWETYRDVVAAGLVAKADAGTCLLGDREACALGRGLYQATHPLPVIDYPPALLWAGLLLTALGVYGAQRARRRLRTIIGS